MTDGGARTGGCACQAGLAGFECRRPFQVMSRDIVDRRIGTGRYWRASGMLRTWAVCGLWARIRAAL
jgi:hypothetical protein